MRRKIAVLTLAVAAGTLTPGMPAQAHPVCASVESTGGTIPPFGAGNVCMPYEYGVECHRHHAWHETADVDLWAWYCFPGIIPPPG